MLYAVKPFTVDYQGDLPAGVGEFPVVSLELPDNATEANLPGPGWVLETEAMRNDRIANTQEAYETWKMEKDAADAAAEAAMAPTVEDTIAQLQAQLDALKAQAGAQ